MTVKGLKKTKCRMKQEGCEGSYIKWSLTQKCCHNPACALALVKLDKEKKARKQHAADKIRLKSRREWVQDAQTAFNAYIRKRDEGKPCISCQRMHEGQMQAGHYLSAGAHPEMRFNEDNCHLQCVPCNNHLSGNIVRYRPNLVNKIGAEKVEWLEGPHEPQKWTIDQLKEIQQEYKAKLKALQ